MARAIRFHEFGGPEVLKLDDVDMPRPGPGEVQIRQAAVGVNFADIAVRRGIFRVAPPPLPVCPGSEAAGIVEAVGTRVAHLRPGDRVAYGGSAPGAYASERNVPADIVVRLPDAIGFETAAGMMSAGLTAAFLLRRMWPLKAGDTILFTAAAGRVGHIAVQWAKALGLTVIGTVGSEKKVEIAKALGCDHVIVYPTADVSARVRELTGGAGVAVAYDSVGAETFASSLKSVRRRGLLVCFGGTSGGLPPPLNLMELGSNGSLFVSMPAYADYVGSDPVARAQLTAELMDHVASGRIKIGLNHKYALADAAKAHSDIENRLTTGSVVLLV